MTTLKQELIKVLLSEAIKSIEAEGPQAGMSATLYGRTFTNIHNSLKSAYSTNSLNIGDDNNAFFNLLGEALKKILRDEITGSINGRDTILSLIAQATNKMCPPSNLVLNTTPSYSHTNSPIDMYGMSGFVGAGTLNGTMGHNIINQPIQNTMGQPLLPTSGNAALDTFLDEVVKFFKTNNIVLNGETSLAAFSSSYVKFLKVFKGTVAEQNSAIVYQTVMKRYFGK